MHLHISEAHVHDCERDHDSGLAARAVAGLCRGDLGGQSGIHNLERHQLLPHHQQHQVQADQPQLNLHTSERQYYDSAQTFATVSSVYYMCFTLTERPRIWVSRSRRKSHLEPGEGSIRPLLWHGRHDLLTCQRVCSAQQQASDVICHGSWIYKVRRCHPY